MSLQSILILHLTAGVLNLLEWQTNGSVATSSVVQYSVVPASADLSVPFNQKVIRVAVLLAALLSSFLKED